MTAHIDLSGVWRNCADPACGLPYHLGGKTAAEILALHPALLKELFDLENLTPGPTIIRTHYREWHDAEGLRHRDYDLPAVIFDDGTRYWYQHGELHRDHDRPAVEYASGNREWWQQGATHRDNDLPAMIDADGSQTWWQHNVIYRASGQYTELTAHGVRKWHDTHGMLHRDNDLPAVIYPDGNQEYWAHGEQYAWAEAKGKLQMLTGVMSPKSNDLTLFA